MEKPKIYYIYDGVSLEDAIPDPKQRNTVWKLIESFMEQREKQQNEKQGNGKQGNGKQQSGKQYDGKKYQYVEAASDVLHPDEEENQKKSRYLIEIKTLKRDNDKQITFHTPRFVGYLLVQAPANLAPALIVSLPKFLFEEGRKYWEDQEYREYEKLKRFYQDLLWRLFRKYHRHLCKEDTLYAQCVEGGENRMSTAFQMLDQYQRYGIYTCKEQELSYAKGRIDWGMTVKKSSPIWINKLPIYSRPVRKRYTYRENGVSEIQRTLLNNCLSWVPVERPSCRLDFGKVMKEEHYLRVLNRELQMSNRDADREVIRTMIRFIRKESNVFGQTGQHQFYAISNFEVLFEDIVADTFGNEINEPKGFSMADINEKGQTIGWYDGDTPNICANYKNGNVDKSYRDRDTVIFDTAYVFEGDCYILDAKYKRWYQKNGLYYNLPGQSGDIYKQYYYAEVMRHYRTTFKDRPAPYADVCNCFVIPAQEHAFDKEGPLISKVVENRKGDDKIHLLQLNTTLAICKLLGNGNGSLTDNRAALKKACGD